MVKVFFKTEYDPKKFESPKTNIVVHKLETYIEDRAIPYCSCIKKLSKISGMYNRHTT